jgi:hypothetical protein
MRTKLTFIFILCLIVQGRNCAFRYLRVTSIQPNNVSVWDHVKLSILIPDFIQCYRIYSSNESVSKCIKMIFFIRDLEHLCKALNIQVKVKESFSCSLKIIKRAIFTGIQIFLTLEAFFAVIITLTWSNSSQGIVKLQLLQKSNRLILNSRKESFYIYTCCF